MKGNDTLTMGGGLYMGFRIESFEYIHGGHFEIVGFSKMFYSLHEVRNFIDDHINKGAQECR